MYASSATTADARLSGTSHDCIVIHEGQTVDGQCSVSTTKLKEVSLPTLNVCIGAPSTITGIQGSTIQQADTKHRSHRVYPECLQRSRPISLASSRTTRLRTSPGIKMLLIVLVLCTAILAALPVIKVFPAHGATTSGATTTVCQTLPVGVPSLAQVGNNSPILRIQC